MMKLADIEPLIWIVVFVMVALAKGWSKLQRSVDDDSSKSDESPSVAQPPRLQPPRPAVAPMPRSDGLPPQQRAVPRAALRPGSTLTSGERRVSADDIRQFVEQLTGKPQLRPPPLPPPPPPVASRRAMRPPVRKATPPPPPLAPESVPAALAATPTVAEVSAQPSRAWQWMAALRDQNSLRNVIIGAEIIGPPKAESM